MKIGDLIRVYVSYGSRATCIIIYPESRTFDLCAHRSGLSQLPIESILEIVPMD